MNARLHTPTKSLLGLNNKKGKYAECSVVRQSIHLCSSVFGTVVSWNPGTAANNATVRTVFIIGPDKKINATDRRI